MHITTEKGWQLGALVALLGCSGAAETSGGATTSTSSPGSGATAGAASTDSSNPSLGQTNQPPHFEIPAYRSVGVGQEIGFGLEVIDDEQDEIRVELIAQPDSADFDPITLTVRWKPTARDLPLGQFLVRITELQPGNSTPRVFLHGFSIDVYRRRQPLPKAGPLSPEVETLITIHDKERLKQANRDWPLDVLLAHSANTKLRDLPEEKRKTLAKPDGRELYKDVLRSLAKANDNATVHPETGAFDSKSFGNPRSWQLIAVRPRLDKSWHELRLVYKAQKSHAATYVMFKLRPTSDENLPPEARTYNNKLFSKMVAEAFFDAEGNLDPKLMTNKRLHSKRVAQLIKSIVSHEDPDKPWAHGTFLGLPGEARLGGGSKRKADGSYASGDAWGWNVMKMKPKGGRMTVVNVPIKGFATAVVAKNGKWAMQCAPKFNPKSDAHDPRYTKLCRSSGHVDLPASASGYGHSTGKKDSKLVSSLVDAANLFREYKTVDMVRGFPLRDPRRDLFEEEGMTCSQCHVRNFGVRDMRDPRAYDSTAGAPRALNKALAPTFFVLSPTERWQPYAIDFQHKQLCKFKKALEADLGLSTSLRCPFTSK